MTLVFFIKRVNHYRFFASIIEEAHHQGHKIYLWHDHSGDRQGQKGYLYPEISTSPFNRHHSTRLVLEAFTHRDEFYERIIGDTQIDFFFSLSPLDESIFDVDQPILDRVCGKWVIVSHGQDSIVELTRDNPILASNYRRIYFFETKETYTNGLKWLQQFFPESAGFLESSLSQAHFVGSTISTNEQLSLDKARIRQKYSIPDNSEILIYLPFPFLARRFGDKHFGLQAAWSGVSLNGMGCLGERWEKTLKNLRILRIFWKLYCLLQIARHPLARSWHLNKISEVNFVRRLKYFCEKNNLFLVIKPRLKFPFPNEFYQLADALILDDESQQNPSRLQELLQVASLTVGGLSTAVLESILAGVPYLNLEIPVSDQPNEWQKALYNCAPFSIYNFPGVARSVNIDQCLSFASARAWLDLDKNAQRAYLAKFLISSPSTPADLILSALVRIKKKQLC
jgi:hypothetical protein